MGDINDNSKSIVSNILDSDFYGRCIYLLGTAEFGAINQPTLIKNSYDLSSTFGAKGSLIDAYNILSVESPKSFIYLCKVTGEHSTAYFNVNVYNGEVKQNSLIMSASEANEVFNDVKVSLTNLSITFYFPDSFSVNSVVYNFSDYKTIGILVNKINDDTYHGLNYIHVSYTVEPNTPSYGALYPVNSDEEYLSGGYSGVSYSKNQMFRCLENTYSIIEGEQIDIIVPLESFMDDLIPYELKTNSDYTSIFYPKERDYVDISTSDGRQAGFYEQLVLFCIKQLNFGYITHGIIGYNNTYDQYLFDNEDEYVDSVLQALSDNQTNLSISSYFFLVSSVDGDLYNIDYVVRNGYIAYCGLLAETLIKLTTTNSKLNGPYLLYNEFNNDNLQKLSKHGIIAYRYSPLQNYIVVSSGVTTLSEYNNVSPTFAKDMHFICNVRMIQLTMLLIKRQYDYILGLDIEFVYDDVIMSIKTLLDFLVVKNIISAYKLEPGSTDFEELVTNIQFKTRFMYEYFKTSNTISLT